MKLATFLLALMFFASCGQHTTEHAMPERAPLEGTWKLLSGTLIEKGDTTVTDYTQKLSFIKIINDTHFAFMLHDLAKGKDSGATFSAGGGKYELKDSTYTEHLEYCSDRQWEGNDFHFTISIKGDTLVQSGVEKIESAGVDRINIEKYVRLKAVENE
ncbi:lipocalin-like domain-containing protein [Foetidibacter luteolus]|uniref:lipocalin-like domain-containing protein n=1 Tax=Foetidibacter luteolus TaxID=2608880 RepID=UPI00129A54CA|nr:lipocalin-like domain-containing protein [Foetidibacter luteolus]